MSEQAFQDCYPDELSHCYGCGRNNKEGHQLKSFWNGDETIAHYTPKPEHMAVPGFVYGGLIASIIDCHGTGSAAAVAYKTAGRAMDTSPPLRFVTASLKVDYKAPTPQETVLELRGRFTEVKTRKVCVEIDLCANGVVCAKGYIVAVMMPDSMDPNT